MKHCFNHATQAIPITVVAADSDGYTQSLSSEQVRWCERNNFKPKVGQFCILPDEKGEIAHVLAVGESNDMYSLCYLANQLPANTYEFIGIEPARLNLHYIAWGLACYEYDRYKPSDRVFPALRFTEQTNEHDIVSQLEAIYLIRDLINTPCSDQSPEQFAAQASAIAKEYSADVEVSMGNRLQTDFPLLHTVGKASVNQPCLFEMRWGEQHCPLITLVGKGVVFDTGGLNLKPGNNMRLMKKDMAGAAHALGLAKLIMSLDLNVRLHVIIPLAENAVSGNAYRPGDIIRSRSGKTVEIGNTDAEGRLVLADALDYACEFKPQVIIDFASLTGAARVAVGTEIAAMFCNDQERANALCFGAEQVEDPIWPLPLYKRYHRMIETSFADICNDPASGYGGAITAALFLQDFVQQTPWIHFDMMAWNLATSPGRPEGGEAMAIRGVLEYLRANY